MNWTAFALLSALFAGLTAVLAKLGTANVNSNLATFVRTGVILVFAFGIVLAQGQLKNIGTKKLEAYAEEVLRVVTLI